MPKDWKKDRHNSRSGCRTDITVKHIGDETWVNARELRAVLAYRQKHAKDNGYINALTWAACLLKDLIRDGDDE